MASEWFYLRNGKKHGPVSSQQLMAMAKSGKLLPTDLIWKQGMATGKPAGESKQLFPESPSTPVLAPAKSPATAPAVPPVLATNRLKETAKTAAQATQLAAERTKLSTVTLAAAYLQLGKHCYATKACASDFPADFQILDQLAQAVAAQESPPGTASASTFGERAKALAGKGMDYAKKQKASLEQAVVLRRLGQAAFAKHGASAGPADVIKNILTALDRIAAIDQQLTACQSSLRMSGLPKRKLLVGTAAAAVVLLLGIVGYGLWGSQEGEQQGQRVSNSHAVALSEIPAVADSVVDALGSVASATRQSSRSPQAESEPSPSQAAPSTGAVDGHAGARATENVSVAPVLPLTTSWNPPTVSMEKEWELQMPGPYKSGYYCGNAIALSPNEKSAAVGLRNGALALVDLDRQSYEVTESGVGWEKVDVDREDHYGVSCISFAPSGNVVAWLILHDRFRTTWSLAIADTRTRTIIYRTDSRNSRFPLSEEKQKPRWQRFGGAALQMSDDQTLIFATGAGVVSLSIKGERKELNGCLPLTTSSRESLTEQEFRSLKQPAGQWFDDDMRAILAEPPRQGVPHPYDASDTTRALKDYYSCHGVALSPAGKYCAVVYTGPVTPAMFKAGRERDAATLLAVYEVGGALAFQQEMGYGKAQTVNAGRRPDPMSRQHPDALAVQEDGSVIGRNLGHVRRYRDNLPEELLFVNGGDNPTSVAVHSSKSLAFVTTMGGQANIFGLGHPEVIRGEGLLCSLSVRLPNVGAEDGFGAITRDFTKAVVGCERTIQCLSISVAPARLKDE